ncbi:uncharacterized protein SAPINGB_P002208 [Magnusiomyces paraingens]|uniref:Mid2 domain-containing protein n=1 Tax=Magnusiomyces paraingens TaxID=2606893 RepID=A0A5E8BEY2_9ASCO|nr:uncharacterized protein SAPINGB_P002208 [Saprochaete ingens]VVT49312.1 unnamed protein product [Saprochaete ingens]
MKFTSFATTIALASLVTALPAPHPEITDAPEQYSLEKRAQQAINGNSVWTSTLANGGYELVTETIIDAVTISAQPPTTTDNSKTTTWVSVDNSGIPIAITPTIVTPGGETYSTSPTAPTSYPTPNAIPPVIRCFGDRVPAANSGSSSNNPPGYPFCTPRNGTEMIVGETYWLTWDPTYWGSPNDIKFVKIYARYLPSDNNEDQVFITDWVSNADGYFPLTILDDYRIRGTNGYMFVNLMPLVPDNTISTKVGTVSGPIIRVIASASDAETVISRLPSDNNKSSNNKDDNGGLSKGALTAAIVVPIIFVILMCVLVYFWFMVRKKAMNAHKANQNAATKGKDLPKDSSLVTVQTNQSTFSTNTNATGNPFHDRNEATEPIDSVELSTRKPTLPTSAV